MLDSSINLAASANGNSPTASGNTLSKPSTDGGQVGAFQSLLQMFVNQNTTTSAVPTTTDVASTLPGGSNGDPIFGQSMQYAIQFGRPTDAKATLPVDAKAVLSPTLPQLPSIHQMLPRVSMPDLTAPTALATKSSAVAIVDPTVITNAATLLPTSAVVGATAKEKKPGAILGEVPDSSNQSIVTLTLWPLPTNPPIPLLVNSIGLTPAVNTQVIPSNDPIKQTNSVNGSIAATTQGIGNVSSGIDKNQSKAITTAVVDRSTIGSDYNPPVAANTQALDVIGQSLPGSDKGQSNPVTKQTSDLIGRSASANEKSQLSTTIRPAFDVTNRAVPTNDKNRAIATANEQLSSISPSQSNPIEISTVKTAALSPTVKDETARLNSSNSAGLVKTTPIADRSMGAKIAATASVEIHSKISEFSFKLLGDGAAAHGTNTATNARTTSESGFAARAESNVFIVGETGAKPQSGTEDRSGSQNHSENGTFNQSGDSASSGLGPLGQLAPLEHRSSTVAESRPSPIAYQIADGIVSHANLLTKGGHTEFQMRLDPPNLGPISINLVSNANGVTAHLAVADAGVRQMIEQQLPGLQQRLHDAGVSVGSFNVSTDGSSGRQSSEQRQRHQVPDVDAGPIVAVSSRQSGGRSASRIGQLDVTA